MAIAGTLAGIAVGNMIKDVIYITQEEHEVISIPRLLNSEKLLRPEKKKILEVLSRKSEMTAEELQSKISGQMQTTWKHLRELEDGGYIKSSGNKPKKYSLTESGWLLA